MKKIRWGILGCGRIAKKFADDLARLQDAELVAVGARDIETAKAFCSNYPARRLHQGYEALAEDPEVDVIYIATPHGLHHQHALLCLERGKAVLCEKAFAINKAQAAEMIDLARSKGIFLMEALWSKFLPHYEKTMEMVHNGTLGSIRSMQVNFGFKPEPPVAARIYDPALGGGTLLDIGIYNVFFTLSVLGRPDVIEAAMTPSSTGVDEQCAVTFRYADGAMAQLLSSFSSNLATEAEIAGDRGRIRLTTRFYEPSATIEHYPGRVDSRTIIPVDRLEGWGYRYEISHVNECLRKGLTESPVMTHADTLTLMETLDGIREKAGIHYPADTQ